MKIKFKSIGNISPSYYGSSRSSLEVEGLVDIEELILVAWEYSSTEDVINVLLNESNSIPNDIIKVVEEWKKKHE